jgi:hypothetical protein
MRGPLSAVTVVAILAIAPVQAQSVHPVILRAQSDNGTVEVWWHFSALGVGPLPDFDSWVLTRHAPLEEPQRITLPAATTTYSEPADPSAPLVWFTVTYSNAGQEGPPSNPAYAYDDWYPHGNCFDGTLHPECLCPWPWPLDWAPCPFPL